jgi:hypothetical protein
MGTNSELAEGARIQALAGLAQVIKQWFNYPLNRGI